MTDTPAQTTSTTTSPTANPFAGIPASDLIRDGIAVLLLLLSFALPWSRDAFSTRYDSSAQAQFERLLRELAGQGTGATMPGDNVAVILLGLLALFAIAVTYLARAGVLPAQWSITTTWLARAGMVAPYLVLALVSMIIDAVGSDGLGLSVALGLAGAMLIASPRESELLPGRFRGMGAAIARISAFSIAALLAIFTLIGLIQQLASLAGARGGNGWLAIASLLALLAGAALIVILLLGVARGSESARKAAIAVGSVALGHAVLSLFGVAAFSAFSYLAIDGYLPVFAMVAGALAATAGARAATAGGGRDTVISAGLGLMVLTAGYLALDSILFMIAGLGYGVGGAVTAIVTSVIVAVGALIARSSHVQSPIAARTLVLGTAGAAVLLGIVAVVVLAIDDGSRVRFFDILLAFGFPALVLLAAYLPDREDSAPEAFAPAAGGRVEPADPRVFAPATSEAPAAGSVAAPATAGPANAAPATAGPANAESAFTAAQALSPEADAATLFRIVQEAPHLRAHVAVNPSTYPDLLEWLGQLDDAAVRQALKVRGL